MRYLSTMIAAAAALGALPTPAAAQTDEDAISLETLTRSVRERSPAARAARAQIAVAEADVDLAGVYPNPELGYQFMGRFDGTNQAINGSQHTAWVDFPLLIAGQHDARRDAAAGLARATRAEVDGALLGLEVEARRRYLALLAAQERADRLAAARAELDEIDRIVDERTAAGAQSRYDEARVRLEISRVDAELADARADVTSAQTDLAALLGRPGWHPRATGSLASLGGTTPVVDEPPAVRAMRLRVEAAQLDVERAERERVPQISIGVGAYLTSDPDSGSAYAGLSIPLPLFDTGEASVSRARAAEDASTQALAAVEGETRARLEGRLAELRARREALERFEAATLAQLPEIQEMAEAAYRLGAAGIFELLDTFRTRFELELQRIELLAAVVRAETEVLAVTGH